VKSGVVLSLLLVRLVSGGLAICDEPQAMSAPINSAASQPNSLDESFLLLPAYDLERIGDAAIRVGDSLDLRVAGLSAKDGNKEIKALGVPPGTEDLNDSGWDLSLNIAADGSLHVKANVLKSGRLSLPSLALQDASGKSLARTNPISLDVESVISKNDPKKDEPGDVQPPVSLVFPIWVMILAGILGLLVVAGVIYAFVRMSRKKRPEIPRVVESKKSEDEIAFSQLLELERSPWIERGEYKKYYFRVSEILKNYLGSRYHFDAPESTTHEMMDLMRGKKIADDLVLRQIENLFLEMDVIKFTDTIPQAQAPKTILTTARAIVSQTKRVTVITPTAGSVHAP
jgi:hypothetical protein